MENKTYTILKKHLGISAILAALLLSGCQNNSESLSDNGSAVSSAQTSESSFVPAESSAPSEEEPPYGAAPDPFPAGREFPDDKLVPSEWLRLDSRAEFADRIAEAMVSDTTVKDPEEGVRALLDRDRVFICFLWGDMLEIEGDSPYDHPDFKFPIYPCTSEYFDDIKTLSDLAYDTYSDNSVAENILNGNEPTLLETDGQMYVNISKLAWRGGTFPLHARSYIEITEKSEDKCTFFLHYPDYEELNAPESGYEFFYFENGPYTAERVDGKWKLKEFVIDY